LGEKKACFNEYQQQRKNEEVTEKRQRLKKAREDFTTMLEETPNLRASTRYSMAASMLEDDPRWKVRAHVHHTAIWTSSSMIDSQVGREECVKSCDFIALLSNCCLNCHVSADPLVRKSSSCTALDCNCDSIKPDQFTVFLAEGAM